MSFWESRTMVGLVRAFTIVLFFGMSPTVTAAQGPPGGSPGGAGQITSVTAIKPLDFGLIIPGVRERVDPLDIGRRGEVELEGRGVVDLLVVYPFALVSEDGVEIELTVATGDLIFLQAPGAAPEYLDPDAANTIRLQPTSTAQLWLGGSLDPGGNLLAGRYTGTIQVLLTAPGT